MQCPHPLVPGVGPVAPRPKGYGSRPGTIQASLVSPTAGSIFPLIQCITSITDKYFFRPLIDKIIEYAKGDDKIAKLPINMISGMLGKSETEASIVHLNKSTEQIMTWLHDNQHLGKSDIFNPLPMDENRCLYGVKKEFKPLETNIPMYIQILDMCNIMLHKMCNNIQGELVARKSDSAVFRNVQGKVKTSNKWGEYKKSDVPVLQSVEQCEEYVMNIEDEWDEHCINDGDDWEKNKKVIDDEGGLLLQGNPLCIFSLLQLPLVLHPRRQACHLLDGQAIPAARILAASCNCSTWCVRASVYTKCSQA